MRLDSKQLVSEFLPDALSNKESCCRQPGRHCFCPTTFRGTRSFSTMPLATTKRTWPWSLISARFLTTTRVPMWKLYEIHNLHRRTTFIFGKTFIFGCVWVLYVGIVMFQKYAWTHILNNRTRTHKRIAGNKRHGGWTGNLDSIWQCRLVSK